jgi:hypothetical protein
VIGVPADSGWRKNPADPRWNDAGDYARKVARSQSPRTMIAV